MAGGEQSEGGSPKPQEPAPPTRTDARLLELLVCPLTRAPLMYDAARQELISRAAGLAYPIRNGVPMMTADAARELGEGGGGTHRR